MAKVKKDKVTLKDDSVNIKRVSPVVLNSDNGPLTFLWGLGEDNKMYLWASKNHRWELG